MTRTIRSSWLLATVILIIYSSILQISATESTQQTIPRQLQQTQQQTTNTQTKPVDAILIDEMMTAATEQAADAGVSTSKR